MPPHSHSNPMRRLRIGMKFRLEYGLFVFAAALLRAMPVETASTASGWLWRTIAPRLHRHARAISHLERAFPEKSRAELETIALAMWENLGRTFAEAFHLRAIVDQGRISFENVEALDLWAAQAGGKVACAAHLGNWELAIYGALPKGIAPWSPYQRIKNPYVERAVAGMRAFLYPGGLVQKGPTVARLFMRVIREGGTVALLSDLRESDGIDVPFFGRPAPTTPFPAILARAAGTKVLVARVRRLPGVRFVHSYELIDTPLTDDRKADIEKTTAMIQAAFERFIRAAPEQWMWAHRRWG